MCGPGKGAASPCVPHSPLRRLRLACRAASSDKVESVFLEKSEPYTMLYEEGDKLVLMNDETYDQTEISKHVVDEKARKFLVEGVKITVRSYQGEPLFVTLPQSVELKVEELIQGFGGSGPTTNIVLASGGVEVKCPGFIGVGETIVVNTADSSYMRRA